MPAHRATGLPSEYARRIFGRFTERARLVIVFAQDEARLLKHNYIGTEHILLGLLREQDGLAARVLESLDVTVEVVRAQIARIVGERDDVATGQIPFTPRAKKVLELALREALSLGHNYIGTEHILLGVVREGEGVAARILTDFDAHPHLIEREIIRMLAGSTSAAPPWLDSGLAEEIDRVREEKEKAIEAQHFDRAAELREQERALVSRARELQEGWEAPPERAAASASYGPPPMQTTWPLTIAIVLAAIGFPLGLLVGWLIWS